MTGVQTCALPICFPVTIYDHISEAEVESALNEYGDFTKPRPKEIPEAPFITDTNAWTKLGLKTAIIYDVAKGIYFCKKRGDKTQFEQSVKKAKDNNISEALKNLPNVKSAIPTAPFVMDTNAWTKLGLKVALKEAVAQGADKISWTTGEQQNERYDLSKQVDEIGWQKNENGTYNITPKKDGSVIGTREMMANLTIKQIEDYVGKEVAEKIQNEEGKVWDGGSVKQGKLTGQQLKVGGKGMIGFYGNPSEGKLGIVGQVAKSLFKQEPQTIQSIRVRRSPSWGSCSWLDV